MITGCCVEREDIMPHKRSVEARQKRDARHIILAGSFHDPHLAETVCRTSRQMILDRLRAKYGFIKPRVAWDVFLADSEKGEVLIDARGRGTLQQIGR